MSLFKNHRVTLAVPGPVFITAQFGGVKLESGHGPNFVGVLKRMSKI